MITKLGLSAFTAVVVLASLSHVGANAQGAARSLELRLVNLSRGYLRPLRKTAERIRGLAEFESVEMLDSRAGVTRFRVKTSLADEAITKALGLKLLDSRSDRLLLAPISEDKAHLAEARLNILAICDAIRDKQAGTRRNGWEEPKQLFSDGLALDAKLKVLGLQASSLEGKFYKLKDYHIDEQGWDGFSVWAGAKYEAIYLGRSYDYNSEDTPEPDPKSNFVGAKLAVQAWNTGFWWVDIHGARFNSADLERSGTLGSNDGKLAVQACAERMTTLLQAAARYRFEGDTSKKNMEELLKGNFNNWQLKQALKLEDSYWDASPYYTEGNLKLSWFKHDQTGHLHARLRAHHTQHPMHLDGDLDCIAARDSDFDWAKVQIHWTVGAESDAGVFERRRVEAAAGIQAIVAALLAMPDAAAGLAQPGCFTGAALLELAKLDAQSLKGQHYSASDYQISAQLMGDVEVRGGSTISGCDSWTLLNLASKSTIRSYK